MKKYYERVKGLASSGTAKDTFILFSGNVSTAFFGFVYTLFVARALSISDFGIFSAATNLVVILSSLTDLGISSGATNFISVSLSRGDKKVADSYIKASVVIKLVATFAVSLLIVIFAWYISPRLIATSSLSVSYWVALISLSFALPMLIPSILRAQGRFIPSVIVDNLLYGARLVIAFVFMFISRLTIGNSLFSFVFGGIVGTLAGILLIRPGFLKANPSKEVYKKLVNFSGWIGVNSIISSISGRIDVQMLAFFVGATATGLYAIPSRLASFIVLLTSSFSAVLAPRMAGFGDKSKEKAYLVKSLLVTFMIVAGIIFWIIIAKPFMVVLFGEKYSPSVPVFQALAASMIPFIFTAPSVTAIIYGMKKTVYIGAFSFFQLAAIFILNLLFIPKYGPIGPTITFGIVNTILAIYTWIIVVNYYWKKD